MNKILPDGRFRVALSVFAVAIVAGFAWVMLGQSTSASSQGETGKIEKMIVANGNVAMQVDLNALNGVKGRQQLEPLRFEVEQNAYFKSLIFNDEFRGTLPSAMNIKPENRVALPSNLDASLNNLEIESLEWGGQYEYVVRDANTGFTYFNIEGHQFEYDATSKLLTIRDGRLLVSNEFASSMKKAKLAGTNIGSITISMYLRPVEVTKVVDGEVEANTLPAGTGAEGNAGSVPGPDVVVGDLSGLAQFGGQSGTQVGLAVGTDSCNFGTVDLNWFANPSNDHPVIPQNLYRMSGGTGNSDRFEQVGFSSVKHAFTALTNNICNLGCNGVGGTRLGSGCSDPYSASLNAGSSNALGSRGWINPFTGAYPRNDSATPNNDHSGHNHAGPSHRILTEVADIRADLNTGAQYFAEGQYITPHEYVWCQANPTQCNMNNNVSYRRYSSNSTATPFSFTAQAATVRQKTALTAWTGATVVEFKPAGNTDGIGAIGYKVTNPSAGVWHYEYAIYNQNLDRAIQSFGIPVGTGVTLSNVGFKAPPQHPAWNLDGSFANQGYSNAAWSQAEANGYVTWGSESFAQNVNANAVRWGTLYNIRFDSNQPPMTSFATVGFLKTGAPIQVRVQIPSSGGVTCSRIPQGNRC